LELTAEDDTLVSFDDLARTLLTDPDGAVRTAAIHLLTECEDPRLVPAYIRILESDQDGNARAEAAVVLGQYVMLGELEEVPEKTHRLAQDALLRAAGGEDAPNPACALDRWDNRVPGRHLIRSTSSAAPEWKASALLAIGRFGDDRWQDHAVQMIVNENCGAGGGSGCRQLALPRRSILIGARQRGRDEITCPAI
jgi:HEAT repeat protein